MTDAAPPPGRSGGGELISRVSLAALRGPLIVAPGTRTTAPEGASA